MRFCFLLDKENRQNDSAGSSGLIRRSNCSELGLGGGGRGVSPACPRPLRPSLGHLRLQENEDKKEHKVHTPVFTYLNLSPVLGRDQRPGARTGTSPVIVFLLSDNSCNQFSGVSICQSVSPHPDIFIRNIRTIRYRCFPRPFQEDQETPAHKVLHIQESRTQQAQPGGWCLQECTPPLQVCCNQHPQYLPHYYRRK